MDPELTDSPVVYINGLDFIVSKTSKGGFADYSTSKWARKESSLSPDMIEAIDQYKLVDLATYLPKRPTPEQLAAMFEMFQASLDGELYDPTRWAQFYKPYGFDAGPGNRSDDSDAVKPAVTPKPAPVAAKPAPAVVQEEAAPWEDDADAPVAEVKEEATATAGKSPQEILAMLRNRNK